MKRFIQLLFALVLSLPLLVHAEGTWEQHTTPNHMKQLLFDDGMIWCATIQENIIVKGQLILLDRCKFND
jgi:hypothetical protein